MPSAVTKGDGVGAASTAGAASANSLLERLCTEYTQHVVMLEEERHFMSLNKRRYPRRDATTQLLHGACEKLLRDKVLLEERRYEDHTAEPHLLFQRLGVDFQRRTSEKANGLLQTLPKRLSGVHQRVRLRPSLRSLFGSCFGVEADFPHNLSCWNDAQNVFVSTYEVLREGSFTSVAVSDLVLGDIIYLQQSLSAPCDLRVLAAGHEATLIDASPSSMAPYDVRHCTTQSTASDPKASNNIIPKGSWVLQGSLLGIVLRAPQELPEPSRRLRHSLRSLSSKEDDFVLDMSLPPGLKTSTCQRSYASLCARASCVCRSFAAMNDLASVKTVLVFLSEELYDIAALKDMLRVMQELGKAVLILGDSEILKHCAQECKLQLIDLQGSQSSASTGAPSPSFDSASVNTAESPHGAMLAQRTSPEEEGLVELAKSCINTPAFGACIDGISEATQARLCQLLEEGGVLYASSHIQPQFLRSVACATHPHRRISEELSTCSTMTTRIRSQSQENPVAHWPSVVTQEASIGRRASLASTSTSFAKQEVGAAGPRVFVVSMNAQGVLAELASAVVRKPDLRCLALAFQILSREVLDGKC
ncbi:unnamed protein product [Durusdinium trenchii]|uniref:P-type ATPase A domain-containing protein n=2 Tax=Durusdinium trenchii TaxID=1381693 RepID=A0ABP0IR00_9DINO